MQRIIFLILLLFFNTSAYAVLEVEITGGYQSATPIAIVPFTTADSTQQKAKSTSLRAKSTSLRAPVDIAAIIKSDLQRSGLFTPLLFNQLPEHPKIDQNINFSLWKNTQAEQLVIGSVDAVGAGKYEVKFKLFDIFSGNEILGYQYRVDKKNLRRVAHQISDRIFKRLTGTRGAFDTLIAYVIVNNDIKSDKRIYTLAVADSDGHGEQIILKSKQPILSPSWSPDGKRLAYVSFEKKRSIVYVQELKTGQREAVAKFKGINSAPRWSPDGKRLAVTLSKDGNSEIYILYVFTGVLQRITNHYGIDTEADWAPDGRSLIFTSDRSGKPQVYQVAVDQRGRVGKPKRLTFEGDYNSGATFSPDGNYIALVTREYGSYRIALLELATKHLQILTDSQLDESPTFAPNGKMVLYATELRGKGILEAISVDGSHSPQRLRVLSGNVREPAWSSFRTQ
jgi:TolB protein